MLDTGLRTGHLHQGTSLKYVKLTLEKSVVNLGDIPLLYNLFTLKFQIDFLPSQKNFPNAKCFSKISLVCYLTLNMGTYLKQ